MSKVIPAKLDKMPDCELTSMDNPRLCDLNTETASTVTSRYYKGIGSHKENLVIVVIDDPDKTGN